VREGGLEPPRRSRHWILNPARLPIPPLSQWRPDIQNEQMEFLNKLSKSAALAKQTAPALLLIGLLVVSACAPPREVLTITARPESIPSTEGESADEPLTDATVRYPEAAMQRFDDGRMWTFEAPPSAWFEEAYGFRPDETWLTRARMGALRFGDICSASLVSHRGLVMTNHHCARDFVAKISRTGERLLDEGFLALDEAQERPVRGLKVRQLIEIEDVSAEVNRAARDVPGWGPQAEAREKRVEAIERRMKARLSPSDSTREYTVVELIPGVRYSLYTYRVYHDVRLVWVPELEVGRFGGETDNFEWPRHTLDAAFFRIWEKGEPLRTADHFMFDPSGADEGEAVFVVGNPGSTERLITVSQLEYQRDVSLPEDLMVLRDRIVLLDAFVHEQPALADSFDVRNDLMGANNQLKALEGQLAALEDGWVLSRTQAWEDSVRAALGASDSLASHYGRPFRDIRLIQQSKEISAPRARAFTQFLNPSVTSHILMRAMYGYVYALSARRGAPPETLKEIMDEAMTITDWPKELERVVIAARLEDFQRALGEEDPTVRRLLGSLTPQAMADSVAMHSALADSAGFRGLLESNYLASKDPTVELINTIGALYFTLDGQVQALSEREEAIIDRLAALRYHLAGDQASPDAGFTLRLTDGRVSSYTADSGSLPAFTRFAGMTELDARYGDGTEWDLPPRWESLPAGFDANVPLNLVATTDITGGNSGSPLLDQQLRIVGLVFDGNRESLASEYVFSDDQGRTIAVDVRALIEVLEVVEDADRLILELLEGAYYPLESEAEAARR
jgi:hypothetical protein